MRLIASTSDIDRRVGVRLKAARIQAGLSQTKIGLALGISFQQIQKYEKGANRIAIGTLYQIASFLNVPITSFLDDPNTDVAALTPDLMTAESLKLVQAFTRIPDPKVRGQLVRLVRAMAPPVEDRQAP